METRHITAPDGREFTLEIPDEFKGPRNFRWPVDFTTVNGGPSKFRGQPPPLSPLRCQQTRRKIVPPIQCTAWAKRGRNFCIMHGGRQGKNTGRTRRPSHYDTPLARYYSRRVGPTLANKLKELSEGDTARFRHSLAEEIDVARVMTEKAVHRFEKVCLDGKNKDGKEFSGQVKAMTMDALRQSLKFVSETVEKSARVRALDASVVEAEHIEYAAKQIVKILQHHLPDDLELSKRIIDDVNAITFPNTGNGSGGVNPKEAAKMIRALVSDMDATVMGDGGEK